MIVDPDELKPKRKTDGSPSVSEDIADERNSVPSAATGQGTNNILLAETEQLTDADVEVISEEADLADLIAEMEEEESQAKRYPVDGASHKPGETIVDKIAAFVRRFVFLKEPALYLLISLWVISTYIYEDFDFCGYLFAHSAEPQSGKSRLLEVLGLLVHNPVQFSAAPSQASVFRMENHTQLLDEVDSWTNREELQGVLNAGFKKGGKVYRVEKGETSGFEPVALDVYGPRALAGIGTRILAPATRDRTFMIRMERRTAGERGERFRERLARPEAARIQSQIVEWLKVNRQRIRELYDKSEPCYLDQFSDRTMDIASPLAAILEFVFEGDERLKQVRETFVTAVAKTRSEVQQVEDLHIFEALLRLAQISSPVVGNATELAGQLGIAEAGDPMKLASVLQRHGFTTKSLRKDGENPLKRYELTEERIAEILERYGVSKQPGPQEESAGDHQNVVSVVTGEEPSAA